MNLLTADVRKSRIVQYLEYVNTLDKGRIRAVNLTRMNRVANFRKQLLELLNEFIEARAEEIAAEALAQLAAPGPPRRAGKARTRLTYSAQPTRWYPAKRGKEW